MIADTDNRFIRALESERPILLDGGLATEMEAQGHDISGNLWSGKMLISNPQSIIDTHRAYLDAGARCIISAGYQVSHKSLHDAGVPDDVADRVIASAVAVAADAREQFLAASTELEDEPMVAASIGPYGAALYNGAEYTGEYDTDADGLRAFHAVRMAVLDECEADVLAVETIPNVMEAEVLRDLLERVRTPAWVSFCCRDSRSLSDGTPLRDVAAMFSEHDRVMALGVNCTSPHNVTDLIAELRSAAPTKAIVVYPNSGERYDAKTNTWHGSVTPAQMANAAEEWRNAGAKLIGGCCRVGPQHIAAMSRKLSAQ